MIRKIVIVTFMLLITVLTANPVEIKNVRIRLAPRLKKSQKSDFCFKLISTYGQLINCNHQDVDVFTIEYTQPTIYNENQNIQFISLLNKYNSYFGYQKDYIEKNEMRYKLISSNFPFLWMIVRDDSDILFNQQNLNPNVYQIHNAYFTYNLKYLRTSDDEKINEQTQISFKKDKTEDYRWEFGWEFIDKNGNSIDLFPEPPKTENEEQNQLLI
jgi:hypothetical protein